MKYFLSVLFVLTMVGAAHADFNYGTEARSIAMGGAGLAVIDDPVVTGAINPAAYAVKKPGFRMMFPSVDFHTEGTSLSNLLDVTSDINASGDNAINLAKKLGEQDTSVQIASNLGLTFGSMAIVVDGQYNADLTPSEGYKAWAKDSSDIDWTSYVDSNSGAVDLDQLKADYSADVTGKSLIALPSVAMGFKMPGNDRLSFGVRIKALQSTVRYQRVQPTAAVNNGTTADPNIDLTFETVDQPGKPSGTVEDSGISTDIGIVYETPNPRLKLTTALVVNNLVKPNLEGIELERMINAGAAVRLSNKLLLAADLVNITGAYNENAELRLGAELTPVKWFALRAGYGSSHMTYGFGIMGINFAFSKDTPVVVGRAWKL